jgi:lysozyme
MEVSTKGKQIIKDAEGLYLRAYICPAGVPTIGWGTTVYPNGSRVKMGDVCTTEQAEEYLSNDCRRKSVAIERHVKVPLSQEMFDALVSWVYNLGEGNLINSTLLKKMNAKNYGGAADEFPRWNKANGVVLRGLTIRRERERKLFLEGIETLQPSTQALVETPTEASTPTTTLSEPLKSTVSNSARRSKWKR